MGRKNIINLSIALGLILPGAIFFRSCTAPVYDVVVVGEKTVTEEDYLAGIVPEDALSWSYWMVDEHRAGEPARLVFHEPEKKGAVPLDLVKEQLRGIGHIVP